MIGFLGVVPQLSSNFCQRVHRTCQCCNHTVPLQNACLGSSNSREPEKWHFLMAESPIFLSLSCGHYKISSYNDVNDDNNEVKNNNKKKWLPFIVIQLRSGSVPNNLLMLSQANPNNSMTREWQYYQLQITGDGGTMASINFKYSINMIHLWRMCECSVLVTTIAINPFPCKHSHNTRQNTGVPAVTKDKLAVIKQNIEVN